jgi:LysM repeat protein
MHSRRKRITLMPAVALAGLSAIVAIPALSQSRLYAAAPQHVSVITVARGENLWSIADRYTQDGGSVQDTIDTIMSANHLASATIHPGERLKIPR